MAVCDQNHSHLQYILRKLTKVKKEVKFFKSLLTKVVKNKQEPIQIPRCPGCAYVMGYKDGLKGTNSNIENVPYREIEPEVNACAELAYQKGFEDGSQERLYK